MIKAETVDERCQRWFCHGMTDQERTDYLKEKMNKRIEELRELRKTYQSDPYVDELWKVIDELTNVLKTTLNAAFSVKTPQAPKQP